jgi:hypothetical protein
MQMVSQLVTDIVVVANFGLVALLVGGIAYAARAERRPAVLWIGGLGVVAWFVLTFALVRGGVYETTTSSGFPPAIGAGIWVPAIVGSLLWAFGPVRRAVSRIGLHWLVGVQVYRVVGGVFLVAYAQNDIPGAFALPAGIGDVLIGLAAPYVALRLARDGIDRAWPLVTAWCALGIADLVIAVGTGFLTAPSTFQQLALTDPNAAITSYPLALIPTFAVPASIVLHVWVLARLRPQSAAAAHPRVA